MKRTIILGAAVLAAWLSLESAGQAQVFIRAPFVRVGVGNGVSVRAPFVNLYVPSNGPVYAPPYQIYDPIYGPILVPPPPTIVNTPPMPPANHQFTPPAPQPLPKINDANAPPAPIEQAQAPTIEAFSKSFQAKAGTYQVALLNPITKQPTTVRFTLPEGTPRRVHLTRDSIEFVYALRQWVRIEFDRDGATVTSRGF